MSLTEAKDVARHFRVLNRREGLMGAMRNLFSGDYRTVRAVDGVPFDIYLSPLVGVGFFVLAYLVWHMGVNSYTGTGS
jgi:ABC-2 type transport system ATP-binding protein